MSAERRSAKTSRATGRPGSRRGGRPSQRGEILEAAVALFAKGGTKGTTLSAIAQRIGVTPPAITHHFGTKEALLREVVANTDRLDALALESPSGASGMELLGAIRSWGRVLATDPGLASLSRLSAVMTAEAFDADYPAHRHFVRRHRQFRAQLREVIELGQHDGSIRSDADARRLATEIIAFMQGAGLQWFLDPKEVDLVGAYDEYFDRLISELSPPG